MSKHLLFVVLVTPLVAIQVNASPLTRADIERECPGTLIECLDKLVNRAKDEQVKEQSEDRAEAAASAAKRRIRDTPTTSVSGIADGGLLDLLSSFLASAGWNETSDGTKVSFEKNLSSPGDAFRFTALATIDTEPELFPALKEKLEELDDDILGDLEEAVGDFASVDVTLRGALESGWGSRYFGRNPHDYVDLVSRQFSEVLARSGGNQDNFEALGRAVDKLNEERNLAPPLALDDLTVEQLKGLADAKTISEADIEEVLGTLAAAVEAERLLIHGVNAELDTGTFDRLLDLVNNQPQLTLEVIQRNREDLTGPSETSVKLRYEMGTRGNVNDFLTWSDDHGTGDCLVEEVNYRRVASYACLEQYQKARPKAGENGVRVTFNGTYARTEAFSHIVPVADPGAEPLLDFELAETEKMELAVTVGARFRGLRLGDTANDEESESASGSSATDELGTARFELEAKYEDVTGDPMRQSRFVATATLSQRLSKDVQLAFSAVYANRPEYLGEVDHNVSARFGLRYKVDAPASAE